MLISHELLVSTPSVIASCLSKLQDELWEQRSDSGVRRSVQYTVCVLCACKWCLYAHMCVICVYVCVLYVYVCVLLMRMYVLLCVCVCALYAYVHALYAYVCFYICVHLFICMCVRVWVRKWVHIRDSMFVCVHQSNLVIIMSVCLRL